MLWNLDCPVGLSQREICEHFNEGNLVECNNVVACNENKGVRGPPALVGTRESLSLRF